MTMNNYAKSEKKLTCCFKIETTICRIFTQALESLKTLHLNKLFLNKCLG